MVNLEVPRLFFAEDIGDTAFLCGIRVRVKKYRIIEKGKVKVWTGFVSCY